VASDIECAVSRRDSCRLDVCHELAVLFVQRPNNDMSTGGEHDGVTRVEPFIFVRKESLTPGKVGRNV
jgi:hypothetical protein